MIIKYKTDNRKEPSKMGRRSLMASALAALATGRVARAADAPHDPFILLLKGPYVPVPPVIASASGPNLGLTTVTLDNSYSRTQIFPVFGIPGDPSVPIGNFYVQLAGYLCAYDLPGGAIAMQFVNGNGAAVERNFGYATTVPDGSGGAYLKGTFDLNIIEATGAYSGFTLWSQPHGGYYASTGRWWLR